MDFFCIPGGFEVVIAAKESPQKLFKGLKWGPLDPDPGTPQGRADAARRRRVAKLLKASREANRSGAPQLFDDLMTDLAQFEAIEKFARGEDSRQPIDTPGSSASSAKAAAPIPSQPSPPSAERAAPVQAGADEDYTRGPQFGIAYGIGRGFS